MIPGDVTLDFKPTLPATNGQKVTVLAMLLQEQPEWVQGMSAQDLCIRLQQCAIPPNAPYAEWREVISRAAYPVTMV